MHQNWIHQIIVVMGALKYYSHTLKTLYVLIPFILNMALITRCNFLSSQEALKPSRHSKSCSVSGWADTASAEVKEFFLFTLIETWSGLEPLVILLLLFFYFSKLKNIKEEETEVAPSYSKNPIYPSPSANSTWKCRRVYLLHHRSIATQ